MGLFRGGLIRYRTPLALSSIADSIRACLLERVVAEAEAR